MDNFLLPGIFLLVTGFASGRWRKAFSDIKKLWRDRDDVLVFNNRYIDMHSSFSQLYQSTPSVATLNSISGTDIFEYVQNGNAGNVLYVYQSTFFSWKKKELFFEITVFRLEDGIMIHLTKDSVEVYYGEANFHFVKDLINIFSGFPSPERDEKFEINIISSGVHGLELKPLDIKPTSLAIDLYYNDDFLAIDNVIKERLMMKDDKGIVLLHGLPGTGKTTYLRHLIGCIEKPILFVSPGVAINLMDPEFIDILIDNPNAVLVIEDAENIIMDRKYSANNSVSNLLNISDGLLSDCLNVQIICTFNSALNMIDQALLRKGRLIAKYEFGKLEVAKAQRLSEHLGLDRRVIKPLTLAELTNPEGPDYNLEPVKSIGFRRTEEMVTT